MWGQQTTKKKHESDKSHNLSICIVTIKINSIEFCCLDFKHFVVCRLWFMNFKLNQRKIRFRCSILLLFFLGIIEREKNLKSKIKRKRKKKKYKKIFMSTLSVPDFFLSFVFWYCFVNDCWWWWLSINEIDCKDHFNSIL